MVSTVIKYNHQGFLWDVHCVSTVVLRLKQVNFKSAVTKSTISLVVCAGDISLSLKLLLKFRNVSNIAGLGASWLL